MVDENDLGLDLERTALSMESYLSKLDFFDLCAKLALDEALFQFNIYVRSIN